MQEVRLDYQFGKTGICPGLWLQAPRGTQKAWGSLSDVQRPFVSWKVFLFVFSFLYFHQLHYNANYIHIVLILCLDRVMMVNINRKKEKQNYSTIIELLGVFWVWSKTTVLMLCFLHYSLWEHNNRIHTRGQWGLISLARAQAAWSTWRRECLTSLYFNAWEGRGGNNFVLSCNCPVVLSL